MMLKLLMPCHILCIFHGIIQMCYVTVSSSSSATARGARSLWAAPLCQGVFALAPEEEERNVP